MPNVTIAEDLRITTEINTKPELVGRMGVRCSEPIKVGVRRVIAVTGVVLGVQAGSAACHLQVQGSSNLWQWTTLNGSETPPAPKTGDPLPTARGPFRVSGVRVDFEFVRVRWVILGPIDQETFWRVSAVLNTGGAFAVA
jgi:hypothetical protein